MSRVLRMMTKVGLTTDIVAVAIKDELLVNGASVLPHKSISSSILTPSIVM